MTLKRCSKCDAEKPLGEFHRQKAGRGGLTAACKDCVRDWHRVKRYGMSTQEVVELWGDACAICAGPFEVIDHCHETNEVRGPLCNRCNMALGLLNDDVDLLDEAARYLKGTQ